MVVEDGGMEETISSLRQTSMINCVCSIRFQWRHGRRAHRLREVVHPRGSSSQPRVDARGAVPRQDRELRAAVTSASTGAGRSTPCPPRIASSQYPTRFHTIAHLCTHRTSIVLIMPPFQIIALNCDDHPDFSN